MKLSAMKPPATPAEPPSVEDSQPEGSIVEVLTPEECARILEHVAAKRGDDDEEFEEDDSTDMQDLWDALSLLDDARDLLVALVGTYKVHAGSIVAPRHMVAEIERLAGQLTNFLDNWDTSHIKE